MHRVVGQITEERRFFTGILSNEVFCPLGEQLGSMPLCERIVFTIVHDFGTRSSNPIWVRPTQKTMKLIEPTIIRNFALKRTKMPFPKGARCITGLRKILREHLHIALNSPVPGRPERLTTGATPHTVFS